MANEDPEINWGEFLKWNASPTDGSRNLSEEEVAMFDVITKRMKEIIIVMQTPEHVLESQGKTPQDMEDMLSELQEHVESIDIANVLCSIGGHVPLIGCLMSSHANIKAKAAEVVNTIVENNPRSKQFVMGAGGLHMLLSIFFKSDPHDDLIVRTKAFGAISSIIMHNNNPRAVSSAFRLHNGYAALRDALTSQSVTLQRIALDLMNYLLHTNKSNFVVFSNLGFHDYLTKIVLSSEDVDIHQAASMHLAELNPSKIQMQEWLNSVRKKTRDSMEESSSIFYWPRTIG